MGIFALALGPLKSIFGFLIGSEIGRLILVGAVCLSYGYYKGDQRADAKCEASRVRVEELRKAREGSLARLQAKADQATIVELDELRKKAEGELDALQRQIKNNPKTVFTDDCRVPDASPPAGSGGVRGPRPRP